ncbi:MAG: hypothetical protein A2021_06415 [Elusimicrobia bacterium GWF2_52_66]|nr:MAG: hypothetical protein A2X33_08305 [Elusimicrobia bacterium GWA2_51_34]OGR87154.1 MAG: hypothetical protein A2021_06415 [Elusimicrobia bacterium GWF2_52_66]HAF95244.1 hypothetical protein [Elusimicrobiota bacterium]HCE97322.1 hypothetical protein [Elusimicrobiota bacterium]
MKKIEAEKMIKGAAFRLARVILFSLSFSALNPLQSTLSAEVPVKFTYQGNLRQSGFLANGSRNMVFRIYNSSTSAVFLSSQAYQNVSISTGVFRVTLEPTLNWQSGSLWLELEVEGNVMSPREEITSSPYAINALLHSGKKYTNSDTEPLSPNTGDLWMDTASNTLKFWNGAWTSTAGSGAPHAPSHAASGSDPITSLGAHNVTGVAGFIGNMLVISTGPSNVIWMNSAGEIYANKFYGDGSGLTGVVSVGDNLGSHIATTTLNMGGNSIVNAASGTFTQGVTASSFTATGTGLGAVQLRLADNVLISSEASAARGGGVTISTNVYIVGFSSATKYYGDGSGLTNIPAGTEYDPISIHNQDVLQAGTTFYVSSGTANNLNVNNSLTVGIGPATPAAKLAVNGSESSGQYIAVFNSGTKLAAWLRNK